MFHLIVYKKSNGEIARVITRKDSVDIALTNMGYNPMLYDKVKVVSQLARINPLEWRIENGIPVKIRVDALPGTTKAAPSDSDNLKLVFIGDKPTDNTGFGNQYDLLAKGLRQRHYNVEFLSFQEVEKLVDLDFDYAIALSDYTSVRKLYDLKVDNWILWFALESGGWPREWNINLAKVPNIVPVTKFGSAILDQNGIKHTDYIPHGVSSDLLRPIPLRQRAVLRRENKVDSNFVISYLGTNVERKHLDLLIESYAKFVSIHDSKRDSVLLLKTKVRGAYDIPQLIRELSEKYALPNLNSMVRVVQKEMESDEINEFINISDLGFNASSGEGFCIPVIEYLMCGVPFLMGDHTSAPELLGDACPLVKINAHYTDNKYKWTRSLINVDHAAELLIDYFDKWKANRLQSRTTLREYGMRYAVQRMVDSWDVYLQDVEQNRLDQHFVQKSSSLLEDSQTPEQVAPAYEKAKQVIEQVPENSPAKWVRITND